MNKANNRITIRLQSDLDGSLGVDHGKDFSLSMLISGHIEAHVEAFRSFLLAATFPLALVDKALQKEMIVPYGPDVQRAEDLRVEGEGLKAALREANDMIAELQEANDMLGAGRGVPPGRVPTNPLSMDNLLAEAERRESAARDNPVDLYAHDSLLEPVPTASVSLQAIVYDEALMPKPPTQVLNVTGIEGAKFGNCGKANGVDAEVAARLNKLVNDPHFQQFAIARTGTPYETVMDAVKFCVDFVQGAAFRASFDKTQPIKFDPALYANMNELFAQWAKESGIPLE